MSVLRVEDRSWKSPGRPRWQVIEGAYATARVVADCPTEQAAYAAQRLLSGRCVQTTKSRSTCATCADPGLLYARGMDWAWDHFREHELRDAGFYRSGAEERAEIVKWLRERNEWEAPGDLADRIESGEPWRGGHQ